jgi:geranylgeranyl transferase type-2 subunit alpha
MTYLYPTLVHGWDYRRFVVSHLRKNKSQLAKIVQDEYDFTTRKINQSFSNYSAWHQRSKLLPEIVANMSEQERNTVAINELDLVKNAIYTDPEDQSAWLYYWWLLGRAPHPIALLGAYQLKDSSLIAFGFNDVIRLQKLPQILDQQGNLLSGQFYSVDGGSLWIVDLEKAVTANQVVLQADTILPSSSCKSIPHDKIWKMQIQTVMREPGK